MKGEWTITWGALAPSARAQKALCEIVLHTSATMHHDEGLIVLRSVPVDVLSRLPGSSRDGMHVHCGVLDERSIRLAADRAIGTASLSEAA